MKKWIMPLFCAVVGLTISIIAFKDLPDQIAIHFNSAGEADNWMSKPVGAFLLPLFPIIFAAIYSLSAKFEKNENKRLKAKKLETPFIAVISLILLGLHSFTIAYNVGYDIEVSTTAAILVGALFIFVGNFIPRMPQSSLRWPKISDDKMQRKAARFQGRLMMVCGVLFLLVALLPIKSEMTAFICVLVLTISSLLISTVYFVRKKVS